MMRGFAFALGFCVLVVAMACGSDDNDGSNPAGPSGRCAADKAAQPCGGDCAFPIGDIDCAKACQNVADICKAGGCDAQCQGINQDVALCATACNGTKQLNCTNVTFGCYASSSDCTAVGTCVASKM